MSVSFPLEIFYDGACLVCSREIDLYRRQNPHDRLSFVDISSDDFNPDRYGRRREQFMAELHVRDADGNFSTGVDAFMAIWQAYPTGSLYRFMAAGVGLPGINLLAKGGYRLFARYRHLLPKRKTDCASGTCNLHPPR